MADKHGRRGVREEAEMEEHSDNVAEISDHSSVANLFHQFQSELDARHDKYERIVKISRDITISSKRAIFVIHRINSEADRLRISSEIQLKLQELEQTKWLQVATELHGEDPYQFLHAYSPGLQEYIEAVALWYYTSQRTLVRLSHIKQRLTFVQNVDQLTTDALNVYIPPAEYLLGIADLTGELMRIAVHSVGVGDKCSPLEICLFIRELSIALSSRNTLDGREMQHKLSALKQSVAKVENACYTLHVRGTELPQHLLAEVLARSHQHHSATFEMSVNSEYAG